MPWHKSFKVKNCNTDKAEQVYNLLRAFRIIQAGHYNGRKLTFQVRWVWQLHIVKAVLRCKSLLACHSSHKSNFQNGK